MPTSLYKVIKFNEFGTIQKTMRLKTSGAQGLFQVFLSLLYIAIAYIIARIVRTSFTVLSLRSRDRGLILAKHHLA